MLPITRAGLLAQESCNLIACAVKADGTAVRRVHPEAIHPFRTDFQRDRDRVLHSHAFRRLEYKTQVFLSGSGDHLRNRLTHTIEVAAIARTISNALCLNGDLTEAVALAHDLGHTPFGHAGERAMNLILADHGGFDHNMQALRVIDHLEVKYPEYNGINLTIATRSALIKHRTPGVTALDGVILPPSPGLEAQVADIADDLTYYGHDVDDGLDSGLLHPDMFRELEIWQRACEKAKERNYLPGDNRFIPYAVRCLIDMMVGDVIRYSSEQISTINPQSPDEVMNLDEPLVSFSPEFKKITDELKAFLYENLYFGKVLSQLNELSRSRISFLYEYFLKHPDEMGDSARNRIDEDGLVRAVADHIAGMTDTFAVSEYLRLK